MGLARYDGDRFYLLEKLLSPEDLQFLSRYPEIQKKFRKIRSRLLRTELREVAIDTIRAYRVRLHEIKRSGQWQVYPALVLLSASAGYSLSVLYAASVLAERIGPLKIDALAHSTRVLRYLSLERDYAAPLS